MQGICRQHEAEYRQAFRAGQKKTTPARLAILEVLEHAGKPISAEEIKGSLPKGTADLATVYRNLDMLKENGWVSLVNISSQAAYYELSRLKHHHHLVCEGCGKIEEIPGCPARNIPSGSLKSKGFAKVLRHSLEYFGVCDRCSKKN